MSECELNVALVEFRVPFRDRSGLDIAADSSFTRVFVRYGFVDREDKDLVAGKARELNQEYPGILDRPCWEIGRSYCYLTGLNCENCPIRDVCIKNINEETILDKSAKRTDRAVENDLATTNMTSSKSSSQNASCKDLYTNKIGGGNMKVTRLKYPVRSMFIGPCMEAIIQNKDGFLAGNTITVHLSPEGYNRKVIATIEPNDPYRLWVDWDGPADRCGARIRAAAKALFELKLFGEFEIIHETGILTMRAVSLINGKS